MTTTKPLADRLSDYATGLSGMTDDELFAEVERTRAAHKSAAAGNKDEAYSRKMLADAEMTKRFGAAAEKQYRAWQDSKKKAEREVPGEE